MIRQPIIVVVGHVNHGKTTLLDMIRGTAIADREAGNITQSIGTTSVPLKAIQKICKTLLDKFKFNITVPGMLIIDTPGHEAFTSLRKRGGSIADIAILVIDINEGIKPQTIESIEILKQSKTPFIIALNKIDKIQGWITPEKKYAFFSENFAEQNDNTKSLFEEKFYRLSENLALHGFRFERFDRITDFTKTIAAVPLSAKTGEGIPELFTMIIGIAEKFLKNKLTITKHGKGVVLEIKQLQGLGTTIDAIIYDGSVHVNDFLIVGGKEPFITKIKALLIPEHMKDMRTEKKFRNIETCSAACGVKINATGIQNITPGCCLRTAKTFEDAEKIMQKLEKEKENIEIETKKEGIVLKSDTIGGLDALKNIFKRYPIKEAKIGKIEKTDIINADINKMFMNRIVIGFNTSIYDEAKAIAKNKKIKILVSDVIYKLLENYEEWIKKTREDIKNREIMNITRPCKLKLLPGCIFRASNPAIVGCIVIEGIAKPKALLFVEANKELKKVGQIKQIQSEGEDVESAGKNSKIAISIIGPTIGRQIKQNDIVYADLTINEYQKLTKNINMLTETERIALQEIKELKSKYEKEWQAL